MSPLPCQGHRNCMRKLKPPENETSMWTWECSTLMEGVMGLQTGKSCMGTALGPYYMGHWGWLCRRWYHAVEKQIHRWVAKSMRYRTF